MGNTKCKQCTASVFENEEEEETWFEWMESRRDNTDERCISPRTRPLPVQPLAFQADVIDKPRTKKSKASFYSFGDGNEPTSHRDVENNNLARTTDEEFVDKEEALPSQINKAITEHKKLVETSGRLQRMLPDKDAFVENLTNARQAAYEIFPNFPAGEVNVSMKYEKVTSRLKVRIIKARNLCCKAVEGKRQDRCGISCSELYIIASLLNGQTLLQSFRTSKKKGSSDILFYDNYAFDLTSLRLNELTLRLTAMHCCKYVINADHVIGRVDTDDKSSEASFGSHWLEVITFSGRNVNKWHTLWN